MYGQKSVENSKCLFCNSTQHIHSILETKSLGFNNRLTTAGCGFLHDMGDHDQILDHNHMKKWDIIIPYHSFNGGLDKPNPFKLVMVE